MSKSLEKNSLAGKLIHNLINFAVYHEADRIQLQSAQSGQKIAVRYFNAGKQLSEWSMPAIFSQVLWSRLSVAKDIGEGYFLVSGPTSAIHCQVEKLNTDDGENLLIQLREGSTDHSWSGAQFDQEMTDNLLAALEGKGLGLISGETHAWTNQLAYTLLNTLADEQHCLASLEDPIIRKVTGVNQYEWQLGKGQSYQRLFELILAQDPDLIYVSELARVSKHSLAIAATGKFVVARTQQNSVSELIKNLINGSDGKAVIERLRFVLQVYLVKQNCPHCLVTCRLSDGDKEKLASISGLSLEAIDAIDFAESQGCEHCSFRASSGEMPLYDAWFLSTEQAKKLSTATFNNKTRQFIAEAMQLNALEDAWLKAQLQLISPLEIINRFG